MGRLKRVGRPLPLMILAMTAMLFMVGEAAASWTCTAHSPYGNHGWGRYATRSAAASRALYECNIRGGGCRLTSCYRTGYRQRRGYRCPSGWCN